MHGKAGSVSIVDPESGTEGRSVCLGNLSGLPFGTCRWRRRPHLCLMSRTQLTVLRPRSHAISVRLSEEEFATLRRMCVLRGARSVSDLARSAMQDMLEGGEIENVPASKKDKHSVRIRSLERKVEELAAELALFKARQTLDEAAP